MWIRPKVNSVVLFHFLESYFHLKSYFIIIHLADEYISAIITSDFVNTYVMQYYDNMRAGTDDFFTTFLGLQLQMSVFIRDTSGSPSGRLKIFDVDDKAPYSNDKGRFISEMGNTPYSEYKDWIQSVWKIKEYLFEGLRGDIFAWGRVSDAAKMFWNQAYCPSPRTKLYWDHNILRYFTHYC